MGYGIVSVDTTGLADALCLPKGCHIVSVHYEPEYRMLKLMIESDALPAVEENMPLPRLDLIITHETDPSGEYYKLTGRIEFQAPLGGQAP